MSAQVFEIAVNRKLTKWFISTDPTDLVLVPRTKQSRPGGSHRFIDGTPRPSQTVKMIYPGGDGMVVTAEGKTRRFDFIIVANHDATIQIGDHWSEGNQHYVIEYLFPYNGYEVKCGGVTHGSLPDHG